MSWDDDIYLGNYSEIGESLRGMQDSEIGAAQAQLRQLRGNLNQLAQRFTPHAPVSKVMRSPYKDSTQIGIKCTGTFTPSAWSASTLPVVTGLTRVYKSFKPTKAILSEVIKVTFENNTLGATTRVTSVSDASDLVLTSAFSGADNCFPNAPTEGNGISGLAFANNSLGNGISWPTINGGIDMTVQFAVEEAVLYRIAPPTGYTVDDITDVTVTVRFNLLGPSLR